MRSPSATAPPRSWRRGGRRTRAGVRTHRGARRRPPAAPAARRDAAPCTRRPRVRSTAPACGDGASRACLTGTNHTYRERWASFDARPLRRSREIERRGSLTWLEGIAVKEPERSGAAAKDVAIVTSPSSRMAKSAEHHLGKIGTRQSLGITIAQDPTFGAVKCRLNGRSDWLLVVHPARHWSCSCSCSRYRRRENGCRRGADWGRARNTRNERPTRASDATGPHIGGRPMVRQAQGYMRRTSVML